MHHAISQHWVWGQLVSVCNFSLDVEICYWQVGFASTIDERCRSFLLNGAAVSRVKLCLAPMICIQAVQMSNDVHQLMLSMTLANAFGPFVW